MNNSYENTEIKRFGGRKIVRKVTIKNNRGLKTVTKYHKGRKVHTVKKPIHKEHVDLIKKGKFVPGLFSDCKFCKSKKCKHCKTKKLRGGDPEDDLDIIERGPKTSTPYMDDLPPDPMRFEQIDTNQIRASIRPVSPAVAEKVFSGPNPEQRQRADWSGMASEDKPPLYPSEKKSWFPSFFKRGGGKTKKLRGGINEKEWEDYVKRQREIESENAAKSQEKLKATFAPIRQIENDTKNFQMGPLGATPYSGPQM
jgi:hypothetical protein